jgi:glycosyltransferase involved in cell wall biosynthesis
MRILTITSNHPPYHSGGYELRIKDIMDGLAALGHQILVLSTKASPGSRKNPEISAYPVKRLLHNRYTARFFPKEVLFDLIDTKTVETAIAQFRPDVIYLAHINILSKAILPYLAGQSVPLVFDEGGTGLKGAWTENGRWYQFCGDYRTKWNYINKLKPLVVKIAVKLGNGRIQTGWRWPQKMRIFFNSQYNLDHCASFRVPIQSAKVIQSGIDLDKFSFVPRQGINQPINILSPGRLEPRKGQWDALNLLTSLLQEGINAELVLVGEHQSSAFLNQIDARIKSANLQKSVKLLGMVSQKDLVKLYQAADFCFFSSHQHFGFSRTPLEAMACDAIVIAYGNEGSAAIIQNGHDGFIAREGCVDEVFEVVMNLIESADDAQRIINNARKKIEQQYSLPEYIQNVERFILKNT